MLVLVVNFIVLPEVCFFQGPISSTKDLQSIAEFIPGASTKPLIDLARRHKVFILAGTVYEKIQGEHKAYNTSVLINDRGQIIGRYRKMNLFEAKLGGKQLSESKNLMAGHKLVLKNVNGFKTGLTICYDLRFPELFRQYAQKGAHVLCVPSAFTKKTGQAHWEVLLRARAIENLCYVIAPNQFGDNERGITNYGHSMIIDPWGKILARSTKNAPDIIYADLNHKIISQTRLMLPAIQRKRS